MQTIYRTHLDALHQWINEINSYLRQNINFIITPSIEANVLNGIQCIANCINLANAPYYFVDAIMGVIILIAIILENVKNKKYTL